MGPAPRQGPWEIRTWNPVASFKVLAASEEWQDHMDQRLVIRGGFTRNKEGGVRCQWRLSQRMRAVCRETGGREPWRADIYKDVWRRGGNSCRREFLQEDSICRDVYMDHVGSGWRGAEMSGECCHPRTPEKDSGLYHRVSEVPRMGAKRDSRGSTKRVQESEQIRSLFLDPLGTCSTCRPHAMKMWVYSWGKELV